MVNLESGNPSKNPSKTILAMSTDALKSSMDARSTAGVSCSFRARGRGLDTRCFDLGLRSDSSWLRLMWVNQGTAYRWAGVLPEGPPENINGLGWLVSGMWLKQGPLLRFKVAFPLDLHGVNSTSVHL